MYRTLIVDRLGEHEALALCSRAEMDDIGDIRFSHTEVNAGPRPLIRSECIFCGMSMLLSEADGSLKKWEIWHLCDSVIGVPGKLN